MAPILNASVCVLLVFDKLENRRVLKAINLTDKRRAPFSFMTTSNSAISCVTRSNNNIRPVRDHHMSLYLGMYLTKSKRESSDSTSDTIAAIVKYLNRKDAPSVAGDQNHASGSTNTSSSSSSSRDSVPADRDAFRSGLGLMQCAVRGRTAGEAIGAQMAAYLVLGGHCFEFSHEFTALPLRQAYALLKGDDINGSVGANGTVYVTYNDYRCRPDELEDMTWYEYSAQYKMVKKSKGVIRVNDDDSDLEEPEDRTDRTGSNERRIGIE